MLDPTSDELVAHVRARLAGYKAPRHVLFVDSVARGPNGKLDYAVLRRRARAELVGDPG